MNFVTESARFLGQLVGIIAGSGFQLPIEEVVRDYPELYYGR